MRLNQFIAHHCRFSRRQADKLIESGRVKVGHTLANTHTKLLPHDKVFVDGRLLRPTQEYTAIIYHKPKGELVSKSDDRHRRVIYDSLGARFAGFSYVGRLDYASEGLLILSDSKQIVHALSNSNLARVYNLKLSKPLNNKLLDLVSKNAILIDIATLPGGIDIEYAKSIGLNAHNYPGIPGKVSPLSSAYILYDYIIDISKL